MIDVDGVVEDFPLPFRLAEEAIGRVLAELALEEHVVGRLQRTSVARIELLGGLAGPTGIGDAVLIDDHRDPSPPREPKERFEVAG